MQIPVQIKIVCWMNKQWVVCVVSNYCVRPRAPCFEIFPVSFGFPEFYSSSSYSVGKKSSAVRTAWAIRSRKFISRSNGSSSPFEINHQPFERLELSVREIIFIHQPLERLKLSVRESNSSAVRMARAKKNIFFGSCYISRTVVTFLFFVYLRLINLIPVTTFLAKTIKKHRSSKNHVFSLKINCGAYINL